MFDAKQQGEWMKTLGIIQDRWPVLKDERKGFTDIEISDWTSALGKLNQEWVREASYMARMKYASDRPKLQWILDAFNVVKAQRSAKSSGDPEWDKIINDRPEMLWRMQGLSEDSIRWLRNMVALQDWPLALENQELDPSLWGDEFLRRSFRAACVWQWKIPFVPDNPEDAPWYVRPKDGPPLAKVIRQEKREAATT